MGGTWHVLLAAQQVGVQRVVSFSSIQVSVASQARVSPTTSPSTTTTRAGGRAPTASSKRLGEDLCEAWSAETGIPTVVLRPTVVLGNEPFGRVDPQDLDHGAFVHVDDVADAVARALIVPIDDHVRLILNAPATSTPAARVGCSVGSRCACAPAGGNSAACSGAECETVPARAWRNRQTRQV